MSEPRSRSVGDRFADAIEARAEEVYPRDVFIPPTKDDFAAINALLQRERGHQLDGVAAECCRRAYASVAAQIRAGIITDGETP